MVSEQRSPNIQTGDAREAILASVRRALATSLPFDAVHREHHGHAESPRMARTSVIERETPIENFKVNLESVGGHCEVVAGENEAAEYVESLIAQVGATKIAVSNSEMVARIVGGMETTVNATPEYLFGSDLGITSAQWGVAETGTLVLESAKESHRLTSLVPPVHLCILRADDIRQTLGEILELTSRELSPAVTFITGASRTSDIELTLAIGVHGPGELHVIVIAD